VRIVMASALMAAATVAADRALAVWLPGGSIVVEVARLAATNGAALAVLAAAAHLLHIREFRQGMALVARKLGRPAS
jgi:hypothetical protein